MPYTGVTEILIWQPVWIVIFAVGLVWSIGFYGYGFWWSLWTVPLFLSWQKIQHDRILRRSLFEYEKLKQVNKEAQSEPAEWINRVIQSVWITAQDYIVSIIVDESATLFEENKPVMVNQLTLENVLIGDKPPTISEVTVHDISSDQLSFDAQFQLYSELSMELVAKCGAARFPILVRDVFLKSPIRINLWLISHPPFISHLQFSFVGEPMMDMIVKPIKIGPDIMSVPGLSAAVKKMMCDIVHQIFVYPNHFEYKLTSEFVPRKGDLQLLHETDPNLNINEKEYSSVADTNAKALEAGLIQGNFLFIMFTRFI